MRARPLSQKTGFKPKPSPLPQSSARIPTVLTCLVSGKSTAFKDSLGWFSKRLQAENARSAPVFCAYMRSQALTRMPSVLMLDRPVAREDATNKDGVHIFSCS